MDESRPGEDGAARATDTARYLVAVREMHSGNQAERTLNARLVLADALTDAALYSEATEVLTASAIDASRLFGPGDARTFGIRLLLGDAHLADHDPVMALCIHLSLVEDAAAQAQADGELVDAARASARKSEDAIDSDRWTEQFESRDASS